MRIVLVVDMFDEENNGTTMTARRFADMLRQRGHQVRVVSIPEKISLVYRKHIINL